MHISRPYKTEQYWTETSGTGTQLAEVSVTDIYALHFFNGLLHQSSFTITIVNDLNTITVSSSLLRELPFYLGSISPKAEEQILLKYRLAAETSINIAGIKLFMFGLKIQP
jgi:hypothetical protein